MVFGRRLHKLNKLLSDLNVLYLKMKFVEFKDIFTLCHPFIKLSLTKIVQIATFSTFTYFLFLKRQNIIELFLFYHT